MSSSDTADDENEESVTFYSEVRDWLLVLSFTFNICFALYLFILYCESRITKMCSCLTFCKKSPQSEENDQKGASKAPKVSRVSNVAKMSKVSKVSKIPNVSKVKVS